MECNFSERNLEEKKQIYLFLILFSVILIISEKPQPYCMYVLYI